jgi:hypothetical protein
MMYRASVLSVARKALRPWFALMAFSISGCGAGSDVTSENTRQTSQALAVSDKYTYRFAPGVWGGNADYNGDGIQDVLISTPNGVFEYLGQASGGFIDTGIAVNNSQWTDRNANFTVGDFNGDGASDFIAQTTMGAWEYLGIKNSNGGFTPNVWARTELGYDAAQFYPCDFSGDGATDVIIVTAQGSFEYLGNKGPSGGFTPNVWTRIDLSNARYTPGDFNGDGVGDAIITTSHGSFGYWGVAGGGFTPSVWARSDLTLGHLDTPNTRYVAGDFNGDGKTDVIVTTASGSFEYTGLQGMFLESAGWQNYSLVINQVAFTPGDFDGDGVTDIIITTSLGSSEWTGSVTGGFRPQTWVRTDLPYNSVWFAAGAFRNRQFDDLIIETIYGSFEYTGTAHPTGFTPNVWVQNDFTLHNAQYY